MEQSHLTYHKVQLVTQQSSRTTLLLVLLIPLLTYCTLKLAKQNSELFLVIKGLVAIATIFCLHHFLTPPIELSYHDSSHWYPSGCVSLSMHLQCCQFMLKLYNQRVHRTHTPHIMQCKSAAIELLISSQKSSSRLQVLQQRRQKRRKTQRHEIKRRQRLQLCSISLRLQRRGRRDRTDFSSFFSNLAIISDSGSQ